MNHNIQHHSMLLLQIVKYACMREAVNLALLTRSSPRVIYARVGMFAQVETQTIICLQ